MTPLGMEPATFQLVDQCLNRLKSVLAYFFITFIVGLYTTDAVISCYVLLIQSESLESPFKRRSR